MRACAGVQIWNSHLCRQPKLEVGMLTKACLRGPLWGVASAAVVGHAVSRQRAGSLVVLNVCRNLSKLECEADLLYNTQNHFNSKLTWTSSFKINKQIASPRRHLVTGSNLVLGSTVCIAALLHGWFSEHKARRFGSGRRDNEVRRLAYVGYGGICGFRIYNSVIGLHSCLQVWKLLR